MNLLSLVGSSIQEQVDQSQSGTSAQGDLQVTVTGVLNVVFGILAVISVVFIILGGYNYMMSQGDAGKIKKGKDTIVYGIIGLVVSLLAFAIVNFVLAALLGEI